MKIKSLIKLYTFLLICICALITQAQTANHCLHFDGNGDRISYFTSIPSYNDWSFELWFKSENDPTLCALATSPYNHKLITLGANEFSFGLCGVDLYYQVGTSTPVSYFNGVSAGWNHMAITVSGNSATATSHLKIYLNCVLINDMPNLTSSNFPSTFSGIFIGNRSGSLPAITPEGWKGFIDEIRMWNGIRSQQELDDNKHCPCTGNEPNIRICSPLDQGVASGQNNGSSPPRALDFAPLEGFNNGFLNNFTLNGPTSNFVLSNAPLIYPAFVNTEVMLSQYFGTTLIPATEICSGDPLHFCINNIDGTAVNMMSSLPNINITVQWQYLDNTVTQFTDVPAFVNPCFNTGPGIIITDCASNPDGFVDRKYRAVFEVTDAATGMSCVYYSDEVNIRICCPLSDAATVEISTNLTGNLLCEGDVIDLTVNLQTTDIFVTNPGPAVNIEWTINGIGQPLFDDMSNFSLSSFPVDDPELCVEAVVTNCAGKSMMYRQCLIVDPNPMCGTIIAMMGNGLLTQVSSSPLVYNICRNSDAVLKQFDPTLFKNGEAHWQYRFPPATSWNDLGVSNNHQNTNTLPADGPSGSPYVWPAGQQCIEYRIEVTPNSNPSGCLSCFSNALTICLVEDPPSGVITGINPICSGNITTLTVSPYDPYFTYTWFHNALPVGSNTSSLTINEGGCYWVELSNSCGLKNETPHQCVDLCEIIPVISCPLAPNPCATPGMPITLSGCDSQDNCSGNLIYNWSWSSGTVVSQSGCTLEHIPDNNGTTYTLTVTNTITGCSAQTELFIKPCA